MHKMRFLIIGGILMVLVLGSAQFFFPRSAVSPAPTTSESLLTESDVATSSDTTVSTASVPVRAVQKRPSIATGDTIASWNFTGVYADNPELVAKAEAEIKRLADLIGKGTYSNTALYVGIANQYELLGNGSLAYDYLGRAIEADVNATSGLPWHNLGVLMERLGALETARVAYEKATHIQSEFKFYHYAYLEFLVTHMRDDTADIEKEFAAATANLGQDGDILQLYSEWKGS